MKTEDKKIIYAVPHSHWDREWYFTVEDSNILLAENMDYLIELLENNEDFPSYSFDGQSSILDEYIKLRPENKERLAKLIKEKRIFVGPWYTQTDTLVVNKESTVRNLLYGTKIAKGYGHSMNIGYLPDIFGQNAYLPSIFKNFGIEYSVLQRGLYNDQVKDNLNFIWKSPDGEEIKANNIFLGYGPGKFLSSEESYVNDSLNPIVEKLSSMNKDTNNLLLPCGGDQVLVRSHFPKTVEEINKRDEDYEIKLSNYEEFMEETWSSSDFSNVICGELIACEKSRIHNTIKSQRYDIKQLNTLVENKIINVLEPLGIIGQTFGLKYPQTWLDMMWKELFDVHAHDSISGCNSDDTNRNIVNRLTKANTITDGLINMIQKQLTKAISQGMKKDNIVVAFNTNLKEFNGMVEATIFTKSKSFAVSNEENINCNYSIISQEYLSGGKKVVVTAEGEKEVEIAGYYRTEILLEVKSIGSLGYIALVVEENDAVKEEKAEKNAIENETYKIYVENSKVVLESQKEELKIENLISFENIGDGGDSYDFSPIEGDKEIIVEECQVVETYGNELSEKLKVKHTLSIPIDLEERTENKLNGKLEILTTVELRKGEELVRVSHNINNTCKDHRVRVLINQPVKNVSKSYADQGFSIIERKSSNPYLKNWRENKFAEAPVAIYAVQNFVALSEEGNSFVAYTKGIKEYEVLEESKQLALTLFRSVGLLGRDNLLWRPGRASGINNKVVYTEDAQMQGELNFEYAITFNNKALDTNEVYKNNDIFQGYTSSYQLQELNTFENRLDRFEIPYTVKELPQSLSLVSIDNEKVYVSAIKKAYDDNSLIIRVFNPQGSKESFKVSSEYYICDSIVNLGEERISEVKDSVEVLPYSYVTLKLNKRG